ncbi:hypothetical protein [Methanobacterium sp. ACI-7]|uniref:hypothetical protein n=1 Tax=unclassified Methanobacterium TaxID=2627676 RepID=UPI0039C2C618
MITKGKSILEILRDAKVISMDTLIIEPSLDDNNSINLNYNFNVKQDEVTAINGD